MICMVIIGLEQSDWYSDIPEYDSYLAQESCSIWPDHLFAVGRGGLGKHIIY